MDKCCHMCGRANPRVEYFCCSNQTCCQFFCNKCIKKTKIPFNTCYVCKGVCNCNNCEMTRLKSKEANHLPDGKNLVRIDEFDIYENNDEEEENTGEYDDTKKEEEIPVDMFDEQTYTKIIHYKNSVESQDISPNSYQGLLSCLICNTLGQVEMLKFKSLEEFTYYLLYFLNKPSIKKDEAYAKSKSDFQDHFTKFFQKYYQNYDYNFKSNKLVCKKCFSSKLKEDKGFSALYNALHIGSHILHPTKRNETKSVQNYETNLPNTVKNTQQITSSSIANLNVADDKDKTANIQNREQNNEKIDKVKNQQHVNYALSDYSFTQTINQQTPNDYKAVNRQNQEENAESMEQMNITNIIMDLENKNDSQNAINSSMNNVIAELKKQFFSIQYYSLLQKLFIGYIFKNLEIFVDKISKNQLLGNTIMSNILNSVPKMSEMSDQMPNPSQQLALGINEQMTMLKSINMYGLNLTSVLNSNIDELKNNGVNLIRNIDPSISLNLIKLMQDNSGDKGNTLNEGNINNSTSHFPSTIDGILNNINPTKLSNIDSKNHQHQSGLNNYRVAIEGLNPSSVINIGNAVPGIGTNPYMFFDKLLQSSTLR